jgi:hypothetical protein
VEIPATLRYVSRAPAHFHGAGTGRTYAFSAAQPVQQVHPADADSLLRTGLFHVVR